MPTPDAAPRRSRSPGPRSLDERVQELLEETSGSLAFNGIRRTLHAHPESLSRTLHRLERFGVVEHRDDGYALAERREEELGPTTLPTRVLAALDPPGAVDPREVVGRLAGRWFGPLRWVGVYDRPGAPVLVWSVDGAGPQLLLELGRHQVRILADAPVGSPIDASLVDAARELLYRVTDGLRSATPGRPGGTVWIAPTPPRHRWAS